MNQVNRRTFLGSAAAAVASAAGGGKLVAANEKVTVALIGCGGMGRANLHDFMRVPEVEIVGLCDVDDNQIKNALRDVEKANRPADKVKTEKDFRRVVERKDLDAVIVGTPDHWHAYVLTAACANGKDVYCEKPLSHNIAEGRAMVNAAHKYQRVVQIGTQQRSGKHFQDAVQFVQSGKLGPVFLCRTWITNRTGPAGSGNPPDQDHAPAGVDYDLWLGPAPERKFNKNRFHGNFRWFWDYGNGLCNDWGVHLNDIILWGTRARAPLAVWATGGKYDVLDNGDTPDTLDVHYEYPGFTHLYTVRRGPYNYGGVLKERARRGGAARSTSHGMEFHGRDGILTLDRGGWVVTPGGDQLPAEKHGGSEQHFAHVQNFLHCMRNRGEKTHSDIEDMHRATTTCHLANISYKLGRRVFWDADQERCYRGYDPQAKQFLHEDGEANALLFREPRKPWTLTV